MRAPGAPAFLHATLQNTLVALWTGDPSLKALEKFWGELDTLARRHPAGIHVLNVISETTGMPDHRDRELLRLQFETMRGRVLALSIVLEKRGVLASLSRAVLSTVLVLSRRPFPMKIHVDRREGALWLAQCYQTPPAPRLLDVLSTLQDQVAA